MSKSLNNSFQKAKKNKQDEFYTQLTDIEKELMHYKAHFKNKTIFCNCDDPEWSNFWKYFELNFDYFCIKKLISTHYEDNKPSYKLEIIGDITGDGKVDHKDIIKTPLKQNGDFRSPEAIEILKESDIIVTNPPFSLFREYIAQLIKYDKKFIIIGNQNAITYKEVFKLIKDNKVWLGYKFGDMEFQVPDYYEPHATRYRQDENGIKWRSFGNMCWFTNLDIPKRHEDIILYKNYNLEDYPKYDEYNAINVNKVADIPLNYDGLMGVPVTFLNKYNPQQFELVGIDRYVEDNPHYGKRFSIKNKEIFARILIKKR